MRALLPPTVTTLIAVLFQLTVSLQAEPSAVSIRVEQANKSDMDGKDRFSRDHVRTLNIFVTNNSGEQLDLKVKHIVFGRDMVHHDLTTVGEGEKAVTVKPHGAEKVETPAAKSNSTEQHYDAKAKKKIEASGATIIGSGVQVMQGEKLVAEWYDPMSLKESWGKTIKPSTPAPKK
ncbi:MAG: hypothetical protein ACAI37_13660 [Chthoniobacter sp.]